jgi:hypothetical protein
LAAQHGSYKLKEGKAAGQGQKKGLLYQGAPGAGLIARPACLHFHLRLHHQGVLDEVNPALLALAPLPLCVVAGGANEQQRHVAAAAKPGGVRIFKLALGALHDSL